MKKFPKMLAIGAMALCSCFSFVGCNNDTPPADPNTEQQTPNNEQQTPDTEQQTPSTDNNNPGGTSGPTQEQLNAQRYETLKTAITKTADPTNYKKAFTLSGIMNETQGTVIDEENFNPIGAEWTEDAKTAFIAGLKEEGMGKTETEKTKFVYGADSTNKVGFYANYDIDKDNVENLTYFSLVDSKDDVYKQYVYNNYGQSPFKGNYNVDDKYYTKYIDDYEKEMVETLLVFKQETIEDLTTAIFAQMEMSEDIEYTYTANFTETDGVYNAIVTVSIPDFDPTIMGIPASSGLTDVNMTMTVGFVYDENGVQKLTSTMNFSGDMTMPADATNTNTITIKMIMSSDQEINFSFSYNANLAPQFNETDMKKDDFTDRGNVDMRIYYYVNGYELDTWNYELDDDNDIVYDRGKYNDDVCLLQLGDEIVDSENLKWYVDPECTVEFTDTKYPSIDLKLYAKVTLAEGYAYVRTAAVDSAEEMAYLEDDDYSAGEIVAVSEPYFDLATSQTMQSAYVNGTHVTSGKINLTEKTFNTIVFISKANSNPEIEM